MTLGRLRLILCVQPAGGAVAHLAAYAAALVHGAHDALSLVHTPRNATHLPRVPPPTSWYAAALIEPLSGSVSCGGYTRERFQLFAELEGGRPHQPHRAAAAVLTATFIATGLSPEVAEWAVGTARSLRGTSHNPPAD